MIGMKYVKLGRSIILALLHAELLELDGFLVIHAQVELAEIAASKGKPGNIAGLLSQDKPIIFAYSIVFDLVASTVIWTVADYCKLWPLLHHILLPVIHTYRWT